MASENGLNLWSVPIVATHHIRFGTCPRHVLTIGMDSDAAWNAVSGHEVRNVRAIESRTLDCVRFRIDPVNISSLQPQGLRRHPEPRSEPRRTIVAIRYLGRRQEWPVPIHRRGLYFRINKTWQ